MPMRDYTFAEQVALQRLIAYWLENWDWDVTPLFGRTRDDYQQVLDGWPQSLVQHGKLTRGVLKSALNEFLNGSAPVPNRNFESVIGLSHTETRQLYEDLIGS